MPVRLDSAPAQASMGQLGRRDNIRCVCGAMEFPGGRGLSVGRLGLGLALLAGLACLLSPAGAAATRSRSNTHAVSPADAAATRAYLVATNTYEEAELANLPQELAAREATAAQISGECPGVLTNAPPHEEKVLGFGLVEPGPTSQTPPSARAEGERRRQSRQLGDLKTELSFALAESSTQPDREASATLVRALTPLRWSNPYVTLFVQAVATVDEEALEIPAPPVCADMTAWVTSGYKTLTPTSRAIASRTEAVVKRAFELIALAGQINANTSANILAPYENAPDKALARHAEALETHLKKARDTKTAVLERLEATVGLPTEKAPKAEKPKSKPVVIARGKSAAGGSFVVKAERSSRKPLASICSVFVTITESSRSTPSLLSTLSGEGTSRCLSRAHVNADQTVQCESGLLTIEASLLANTRSVRLLLSNGNTITSPAIRVPARLGGPAGLYYQAVRGPTPIPVSLTELDASGGELTVLKLPAVMECTKHPVKHFPGGNVQLAHESPPDIPTFTIRGEHFRKLGIEHFELKFEASNEERLFGGGEGSGGFGGSVAVPNGSGRTLEPMASSGCEPQPYAIIYGLLKAPRDTVLARVSGKLVPLHKVAIPAREHAGGVLVYGAFSPLPTELIIRDASGETVNTRSLAQAARSETESCEGEAEGP